MTHAEILNLDVARDDIAASSAGGAPFLICFGVTLFATAIASFFITREPAAIIVMFQGNAALPAAFWLERKMAMRPMTPGNPLASLSVHLAMSQIVAFPIVIATYSYATSAVPLAMASIAGAHFVPYAWLHRTRAYIVLGIVVAGGAMALQILLGGRAFSWVLILMSVSYWAAAPIVYRHAARVVRARIR
ncbi:MAG TPA: hypothetical protein VFO19_05720 [Vicinamibacterales bacterium]|nr:hypothetical protein [Vicinamibacterales bacterium]